MKLELLKDHLEQALQTVARVSNKNLSLPVLGCVVMVASEERTVLRATNLDVSVEVALKAKVEKPGSVAVPAQVFLQTISTTTDQKITLNSNETTLIVKGSHGTSKLKTVDTSEFPTLPFVKEGEGVSVSFSTNELIRAFKAVSFAAATSGMRPELGSVFIKISEGKLVAAATDSFRLAEIKLPLKTKHSADPLLVPVRNITDILRVVNGTDTVEVRIGENQVTFIAGGNYITSRIIDGAFPEYGAILPKSFTTTATLLTEDVIRSLRKLAVFVDNTGQIKIEIDPNKKSFLIDAVNSQVGEAHETIDATLEGEPLTLFFNIRYILDALGVVSSDSVVFKFSGAGKPLIIGEVQDKGFTYLVMPMNK